MMNEDLQRRISEIEAHPESALQSASQTYRKYISSLGIDLESDMKDVEWRDIKSIYRNLRYISDLKTSTLEGAKKAYTTWQPIYKKMEEMYSKNPEMAKTNMQKIDEIVNKLYEISDVYRIYKYEIRDAATDMVNAGMGVDASVEAIDRIYNKTISYADRNTSVDTIKVIFSKNVKKYMEDLF